jgi:hypothetical protein
VALFGLLRFLLVLVVAACSLRDPPSVTPAAPLPADPPIKLDTMQVECDAMIAALTEYKACKNNEEDDRRDIESWIETANRNFAASRKASPEPNAQAAIAGACHRATASVKAANERCNNGPRPKQ